MKKNILFLLLSLILSTTWGQGLRTQGQIIVNENGEEVLLRGYGPGGWQIMEGYMMQTSGFAGSQHEIKEKLIDLMGEANTETLNPPGIAILATASPGFRNGALLVLCCFLGS